MDKRQFIKFASDRSGIPQNEIARNLEAIMSAIKEALVNRERVKLVGWGLFETRPRARRECHIPGTATKVQVPDTTIVVFVPGKPLKEAVAYGPKMTLEERMQFRDRLAEGAALEGQDDY